MYASVQWAGDDAAREALDRIWIASQDADDRAFRPRGGWWSLSTWAARAAQVYARATPIGGIAVKIAPDGALETRVALLPAWRTPQLARRLVRLAFAEAERTGVATVRLTLPAAATWARDAAADDGFAVVRSTLVMRRSAALGPLAARTVPGVRLRPLGDGEEGKVLHALNHAWAGTWNFRPLTRRALARDLAGQRAGFLLALDDAERIAGTVHAQFDPAHHNPGGGPFAWLSNLTTSPAWRGRGLGRLLLSAGIAQLHQQGATSVTLGVDHGALAPLSLYRSADFVEIDRLELWERRLDGTADVLAASAPDLSATERPRSRQAPIEHGVAMSPRARLAFSRRADRSTHDGASPTLPVVDVAVYQSEPCRVCSVATAPAVGSCTWLCCMSSIRAPSARPDRPTPTAPHR